MGRVCGAEGRCGTSTPSESDNVNFCEFFEDIEDIEGTTSSESDRPWAAALTHFVGNGFTVSGSSISSSSPISSVSSSSILLGSALHVQSNDRPIELTPYENPIDDCFGCAGGAGGWMAFESALDLILVVGESQTIGELSHTLGLIPK